MNRLLGRAKETARSDDNEAVIRHRLDLYHEQTEAVVANYAERGILIQVDGMGAIDDVTEGLMLTRRISPTLHVGIRAHIAPCTVRHLGGLSHQGNPSHFIGDARLSGLFSSPQTAGWGLRQHHEPPSVM
ncbi:hypothetical protein NtRootA9_08520 [Arthrobacter sp. NtRootA9]|nr:hypothetical protein NtRootA9_08520 [Arthrobacter sp. NtRootA9]